MLVKLTGKLYFLVVLTLLASSPAEARVQTLRWLMPDHESHGVTSFRLYLRHPGEVSWRIPLDVSMQQVTIDSEQTFSTELELPSDDAFVVALSAVNAAGESDLSNALLLSLDPNEGSPVDTLYIREDFERFQGETSGWIDTGPDNARDADSTLYGVAAIGGSRVLFTASSLADTHSHLERPAGSEETWRDYEVTGRLRMDQGAGGIGVTVYSQYPARDAYYGIRSLDGQPFEIALHPEGAFRLACASESSSLAPSPEAWIRYRIRLDTHDRYTTILARVWEEGMSEPTAWSIDCAHSEVTRLHAGAIGVWATGSGQMYWDDFEVVGHGAPGSRSLPPIPVLEKE